MKKEVVDRSDLLIDDTVGRREVELTPEEDERIGKELEKYGIKDINK